VVEPRLEFYEGIDRDYWREQEAIDPDGWRDRKRAIEAAVGQRMQKYRGKQAVTDAEMDRKIRSLREKH
jgi:hypothetical protein